MSSPRAAAKNGHRATAGQRSTPPCRGSALCHRLTRTPSAFAPGHHPENPAASGGIGAARWLGERWPTPPRRPRALGGVTTRVPAIAPYPEPWTLATRHLLERGRHAPARVGGGRRGEGPGECSAWDGPDARTDEVNSTGALGNRLAGRP